MPGRGRKFKQPRRPSWPVSKYLPSSAVEMRPIVTVWWCSMDHGVVMELESFDLISGFSRAQAEKLALWRFAKLHLSETSWRPLSPGCQLAAGVDPPRTSKIWTNLHRKQHGRCSPLASNCARFMLSFPRSGLNPARAIHHGYDSKTQRGGWLADQEKRNKVLVSLFLDLFERDGDGAATYLYGTTGKGGKLSLPAPCIQFNTR